MEKMGGVGLHLSNSSAAVVLCTVHPSLFAVRRFLRVVQGRLLWVKVRAQPLLVLRPDGPFPTGRMLEVAKRL